MIKSKNGVRRLSEFGRAVPKVEIENVVASASLGLSLNLEMLSQKLDGAEYKPERFPGVVLRMESPKSAVLIFRSGKIVCTGAKSVDGALEGFGRVLDKMHAIGIDINGEPELTIQNIVASADLMVELDLDAISAGVGLENVEYEPEMFPGLVYRLDEPKTVALLFGSGKMIIAGAKKVEDCRKSVDKIVENLSSLGLIRLQYSAISL
jgi:transcription initiation factor TFIID TATA-box-binding protein